MVVRRLEARAWLEDPSDEVRRVRRELRDGDDSWSRWLQELARGEAVIASLQVAAHVTLPDGSARTATAESHALWLEVRTHPPLVEAQIYEILSIDCAGLAERLREMSPGISIDEVCQMYVHIELEHDLLEALQAPAAAVSAADRGPTGPRGRRAGR
jgi:hypothetical protein